MPAANHDFQRVGRKLPRHRCVATSSARNCRGLLWKLDVDGNAFWCRDPESFSEVCLRSILILRSWFHDFDRSCLAQCIKSNLLHLSLNRSYEFYLPMLLLRAKSSAFLSADFLLEEQLNTDLHISGTNAASPRTPHPTLGPIKSAKRRKVPEYSKDPPIWPAEEKTPLDFEAQFAFALFVTLRACEYCSSSRVCPRSRPEVDVL